MKHLIVILLIELSCAAAFAEQNAADYPNAAVTFLDGELPQMEKAVLTQDREYFKAAIGRMNAFLVQWGLRSNPVALESFPMCTEAVTDFLIVGVCRISPPGSICEPSTFIPKFEQNLAKCRLAGKG